jgi:hypothetical protein
MVPMNCSITLASISISFASPAMLAQHVGIPSALPVGEASARRSDALAQCSEPRYDRQLHEKSGYFD